MSILFANSLENYATILTFRGMAYILGHMLIVGITIWALLVGFMKFRRKDVIYGLIFILTLFVLSVPINNLFNMLMPNHSSNYFYTMILEGGTPLEYMYNLGIEITVLGMKVNLKYMILLLILGAIIYYGIYLFTILINKRIKIREEVL